MTNFISSTLAVQLRNTKIFKLEGKTRENEMFLLTSLYDLHAQCEWGVFTVKQYSCVDVSFYADKLWKSKMSTDFKKKKAKAPTKSRNRLPPPQDTQPQKSGTKTSAFCTVLAILPKLWEAASKDEVPKETFG